MASCSGIQQVRQCMCRKLLPATRQMVHVQGHSFLALFPWSRWFDRFMLLTILLNIVLTATSFYGEPAGFIRGQLHSRVHRLGMKSDSLPAACKPCTFAEPTATTKQSFAHSIPCHSARGGQHRVLRLCAGGAGRQAGSHGPAALLAQQLAQAGRAAVCGVCCRHHYPGGRVLHALGSSIGRNGAGMELLALICQRWSAQSKLDQWSGSYLHVLSITPCRL